MRLSPRLTLIAGIALIVITNAVALAGVAWNRAGEPDSVLVLTERELRMPYLRLNREDSGMAFSLDWRVAPPLSEDAPAWFKAGGSGSPEWLDRAKMETLGFVFRPAPIDDPDRWRRHREQSREVLLVLELDGPAYRHSLARVRDHTEAERALLAANPDSDEFVRRAGNARDRLQAEEHDNSRLFVVDAGLAHAPLRAAYPDRNRHVIVRGLVAPWHNDADPDGPRGFIRRVHIEAVNVPFAYRAMVETAEREAGGARGAARPRFRAEVAFGQRLEPWLVAVTPETDR